MSTRTRGTLSSLVVSLLAIGPVLAGAPRPHFLAGTIDVPGGDPIAAVSPDGEWFVFYRDELADGARELWSVRRWAGSVPVRLGPGSPDPVPIYEFWIAADSRHVVWIELDPILQEATNVWSAPIDGSSPAVLLSPPPQSFLWPYEVALTPDGSHVLFRGPYASFANELWSAPIDASSPAVLLQPPQGTNWSTTAFRIAPNGSSVLFSGFFQGGSGGEVWAVPPDASSPAIKIGPPPGVSGGAYLAGESFSPNSTRALFFTGPSAQLWSASLTGPPSPVALSPPILDSWTAVHPDSTRVLYEIDSDGDSRREIWVAPIVGPLQARVQILESPLTTGGPVNPSISALLDRVVFACACETPGVEELWSVPIAANQTPLRLNPTPVPGGRVDLDSPHVLTPNGARVVFEGDLAVDGRAEIWSSPVDGSTPAIRLTPDQAYQGGGTGWSSMTSDGAYVAYVAEFGPSGPQLWRAPISGVAPPLRISPSNFTDVRGFALRPGTHRVDFIGEVGFSGSREVWSTPLATGVPLLRLNPLGLPANDAWTLGETPDALGTWFVGEYSSTSSWDLWISDEAIFRSDFEEANTSEWSSTQP